MKEKSINLTELSYKEIRIIQHQLSEKRDLKTKRIKELEKISIDYKKSGNNLDISKEIINEDIPEIEVEIADIDSNLKEINAYLANIYSKSEMIARNIDVELTISEANAIIDIYSELKISNCEEISELEENIEDELKNKSNENDDFDDKIEELYSERESLRSQIDKYDKIISYATSFICKKLQ